MINSIVSNLGFNPKDIFFYVVISPIVIFWVWTILWTTKDISQRTDNLFYQMFCVTVVAIGSPFIGFPLYFVIRPSNKIEDMGWKDAIKANTIKCIECDTYNLHINNFCTECGSKLNITCKQCGENYYYGYNYCPICGAPNTDIEDI